MAETKSTTLTVRVHPQVKERRSLANMIEVMIRDYCSRAGVALEDKTAAR